jgi:hypothetical protein
MLDTKDINSSVFCKVSSLPDMSAITTPEVPLPTLSLDPLAYHQPVASIHLDHKTYQVSALVQLEAGMNYYPGSLPDTSGSNYPGLLGESKPHVRIIEQPKTNSLRFRYQCEGRGAGALQGQHSTPDLKTFPKIQIFGYQGPAVVVVSCVTHDTDPPRPHPHNLVSPASVGREGCKKGVCTMNVNSEDMTVEFQHLGIQCVRKKDIEDSLRQRKEIRVDPYRQGFKHMENPQSIDLNAVKLCFQVFLENPQTPGKFTVILPSVCSNSIFDAKAKKELQIMDISSTNSSAEGGKKIIILCEKVTREDIKVKFSDPDPTEPWEAWGEFSTSEVHKQYAISLRTPRYKDGSLTERRRVYVELVKPSDDTCSEPQDFWFLPVGHSDQGHAPTDVEDPLPQQPQPLNKFSGGCSLTEIKKERVRIKSESGQWPVSALSPVPLSTLSSSLNSPGNGYQHHHQHHHQQQQMYQQDYHLLDTPPAYIPNIPHVQQHFTQSNHLQQQFTTPGIPAQFTDPTTYQDQEVENLSGKLDSFSLSDAIDASLNMQGEVVEVSRHGKRSSRTAALESGSNIVPREMARLGSDLHTPNHSGNLSGLQLLTNCSKPNDLS